MTDHAFALTDAAGRHAAADLTNAVDKEFLARMLTWSTTGYALRSRTSAAAAMRDKLGDPSIADFVERIDNVLVAALSLIESGRLTDHPSATDATALNATSDAVLVWIALFRRTMTEAPKIARSIRSGVVARRNADKSLPVLESLCRHRIAEAVTLAIVCRRTVKRASKARQALLLRPEAA